MKVLDLQCPASHVFEGWFGSEDDFQDQSRRGVVQCPLCGDSAVTRLPSAPRLNLSGACEPAATPAKAEPAAADLQALWMQVVRHAIENTDDVGTRFAEEARRIHNAAAYSTEGIEIWFARGLTPGPQSLDTGEFLEVVAMSLDELDRLAQAGQLTDVKTLVGLQWLRQWRRGEWSLSWATAGTR